MSNKTTQSPALSTNIFNALKVFAQTHEKKGEEMVGETVDAIHEQLECRMI